MTEAEDLLSQRVQLLKTIAAAEDEIKAIDARLEFFCILLNLRRISAVQAHMKQGLPLAPGMEIAYIVKDAKKLGG